MLITPGWLPLCEKPRGMLTAASILSFGTGIWGRVWLGMLMVVVVVVTTEELPVLLPAFCRMDREGEKRREGGRAGRQHRNCEAVGSNQVARLGALCAAGPRAAELFCSYQGPCVR